MAIQLSSVILASLLAFSTPSVAEFPPPVTYSTVLKSPINPNITISYKSPEPGTCTTAYEKQKQYTGYVNLPPFTLHPYQQDYSVNTFFWFTEARENPETAPLAIWLNGGPGSSSMIGMFQEAGPCEVVQLNDGSYGTQARTWGWDRSSNVLFIDQPTQVGFSYDELVNASLNLFTDQVFRPPQRDPPDVPPYLFLNGTFPSRMQLYTQNTSFIAASASWHFLQGFLSAFPQYNPGTRPNSTATGPTGVNLFAESYGGLYGPVFARYFETQNAKRAVGQLPRNSTLEIKLASLGIINGLVDELIQAPHWPGFLYNNTYGLQLIDQTTLLNALSDFRSPGGCQDQLKTCRESVMTNDPQGGGDNTTTNSICLLANTACGKLEDFIRPTGKSVYDIRVSASDTFLNYAHLEYLNNADVQSSIGVKVNYTESSKIVYDAFTDTGDEARGTQLSALGDLLRLGTRVAFIYGDADYICNWQGGEAVSMALAAGLPAYNATFQAAGYADIIVNASNYIGGAVRQYGNLSFSRIYDAGHTVPSYQPETAFVVFSRIIQGTDIGTGRPVNLSNFGTTGPLSSAYKNKVPSSPRSRCWIREMNLSCSARQQKQILDGQGVVLNGVWYEKASDYKPPSTSVNAGTPGSYPATSPTSSMQNSGKGSASSSTALTGVYTATGTPKAKSGTSSLRFPRAPKMDPYADFWELLAAKVGFKPPDFVHSIRFTVAWTVPVGAVGLLGLIFICFCIWHFWHNHHLGRPILVPDEAYHKVTAWNTAPVALDPAMSSRASRILLGRDAISRQAASWANTSHLTISTAPSVSVVSSPRSAILRLGGGQPGLSSHPVRVDTVQARPSHSLQQSSSSTRRGPEAPAAVLPGSYSERSRSQQSNTSTVSSTVSRRHLKSLAQQREQVTVERVRMRHGNSFMTYMEPVPEGCETQQLTDSTSALMAFQNWADSAAHRAGHWGEFLVSKLTNVFKRKHTPSPHQKPAADIWKWLEKSA